MNESSRESPLFEPIRVGALDLANRVVMAPLTRSRAGAGDAVGALNAEYYAQRASAGLIVSEATFVSPQAKGYMLTPGIYTDEQVAGWKVVTDAVHAKGGKIVAQLWHVGRVSHPSLQPDGALPVAPSALKPRGAGVHRERIPAARHAARTGARRDPGHRRAVPPCDGVRPPRGLRRGRDPRRERLPHRAVPEGRGEPAHRRVRRLDREPGALRAGGGAGRGGGVERRPRRVPRLARER